MFLKLVYDTERKRWRREKEKGKEKEHYQEELNYNTKQQYLDKLRT